MRGLRARTFGVAKLMLKTHRAQGELALGEEFFILHNFGKDDF